MSAGGAFMSALGAVHCRLRYSAAAAGYYITQLPLNIICWLGPAAIPASKNAISK